MGSRFRIVRAVKNSLSGVIVSRVSGILNGTCNYILSEMLRTGAAYETVLAEAQRLGYAEADPAFDIVLMAVKSYDTRWLAELIKPFLKQDGWFVGVQNSMNDDTLDLHTTLYEETVPGGGQLSFVLKRGQLLRLTDLRGGANVSLTMLNANEKSKKSV